MIQTFAQLIDLSSNIDFKDGLLTCPSYDNCQDCMNHELGSFHYKGGDDANAYEFVFIQQGLKVEKHDGFIIKLPTRVRELSTITVYDCELHGPWIEHRAFHKGCTYAKKLRVSVEKKGPIFDSSDLANEFYNFKRND